jgi:sugar O-acyltransferase (sialic acid O-acetyltransferase NeuD family)
VRPLVIVGAGGQGREALDVVEAIADVGEDDPWDFRGFLARDAGDEGVLARRGARILGSLEVLDGLDAWYALAVGDPQVRRRIDVEIGARGRGPAMLVHPTATVAADALVGDGLLAPAGSSVGSGARLGRHVLLNVNAVVESGSVLADHVTLSPGSVVGADARLGEAVLVGVGAVVAPGVRVGREAVVGAGARVVDDIGEGTVVVGRPARVIGSD